MKTAKKKQPPAPPPASPPSPAPSRASSSYDLTDAEKRDLIELIKQGKPLPEKYRFLLFADKREVELVWNGKTREVCTAILPFQTLEHIDEVLQSLRGESFSIPAVVWGRDIVPNDTRSSSGVWLIQRITKQQGTPCLYVLVASRL